MLRQLTSPRVRLRHSNLLLQQRATLPRQHLHVRSVSVLSGISKLAGRTAGRGALGLGLGAGALTWADQKVDGFKTNVVGTLNSISTSLGESYVNLSDKAAENISTIANTLSSTAGTISEGAAETWADAAAGLDRMRERLKERFNARDGDEDGSEQSGRGAPPPPPPSASHLAGAAALSAAAAPFQLSTDDTVPGGQPAAGGDDLLMLTKKLIEIRTILLSIGEESGLTLPSIVVVGSQSSGKSSVLEAIVGREFLPKGDNMVTRRPIELTLIHTPPTSSNPAPLTTAEFPGLGMGQLTDFEKVQQTLLDMNLSVPASECVSSDPIHLRIYSPSVPDLSLVDLPGYVQISSMDQPAELKDKIAGLCEKYIKSPNIILAVCAADVDLANSPALRAAKKVDPLGLRTVGVVSKMDLVDPAIGGEVLSNKRYPLALGYVGVVAKVPKGGPRRGLRRIGGAGTGEEEAGSLVRTLRDNEDAFFNGNQEFFSREGINVGTETLKKRLMEVLESSMSSSLHSISNAVGIELEEARYRFKVLYNDRAISAEGYVAETMDSLKGRIGELGREFSKKDVRALLKGALDEQVLDLLAGFYWNDERVAELSSNSPPPAPTTTKGGRPGPSEGEGYWERKLEAISGALTKSGVGRSSTQLVVDAIRGKLAGIGQEEPLVHHPNAGERVIDTADGILRERFALTSDQVENSVKPFKYEVEVEGQEWEVGRARAVELVQRELGMCEAALGKIRDAVGGRKLRGVMEFVGELEEKERRKRERRVLRGEDEEEEEEVHRPSFNPILLEKAREAMFLSSRAGVLRMRLLALKSKKCKAGPDQKSYCPEAFLNVVADKLSHTAVQFINIELLVEFFYQFPREIDSRLGYDLDRAEVLKFARENPLVEKHLTLQERKEKLELVAEKLDTLVKLQRERAAQQNPGRRPDSARKGGLFGSMF
ncbi:dynamin GTPase [Pseudohyphozyma bogoriensis]|nr:dynamin GTPase [Pseudohyphozyma bogoriensis]